jgi:hypothetical protein
LAELALTHGSSSLFVLAKLSIYYGMPSLGSQ